MSDFVPAWDLWLDRKIAPTHFFDNGQKFNNRAREQPSHIQRDQNTYDDEDTYDDEKITLRLGGLEVGEDADCYERY